MGGGGGGGKSNDKATAAAQERIAANQLAFDQQKFAEQAARQASIDAYQKTVDDRRYALDLRGEERADKALAFQNTLALQQLDYQRQRDEKLYGLQQQQFELTQQDLKFYQDQATQEKERIAAEREAERLEKEARRTAGAEGYDAYKAGLEQQLRSGVIGFEGAQQYLKDYTTKYEMFGKDADASAFAELYSQQIAPARFETGVGAAYEEILGRKATDQEAADALKRFKDGYYGSISDLKDSLYKGQEYQKKFNKSYLDSYYDTTFGDELKDEEGVGTGKRKFTFDKNLLPSYGADLSERTGVNLPDFADEFTGTPAELEEQLQNVRESRQFLYSAGLTNLQGEIDQQTQKIKNEGMKEIQKIAAQGDVYKSVIGSFSF
jgi:hypothetical protein